MKAKRRKPGRPRKPTHAPRFTVSVSRETKRAIDALAIKRGMTQAAVVEMVTAGVGVDVKCVEPCADCQAEKAF